MMLNRNKIDWIYVYYGVLFIVLASWTSVSSVPPAPLRFGFLFALVLPMFVSRPTWAPVIFTMFLTVSHNSFSQSFMPDNRLFYVLILMLLIAVYNKTIRHIKLQPVLLFLILNAFIANFISSSSDLDSDNYYYSLITVFLFAFLVPKDDTRYPHFFSYAFIIASLALSVLFLQFGQQFGHVIGGEHGERNYWKDPNYWGCVVGMGTTASFVELFMADKRNILKDFFLIVVVIISFVALFLNASRGAILSVSLGFSVRVLFSQRKKGTKVLVLLSVAIGIFVMYNSGVMDYFVYRLSGEDDIGGANGRFEIWAKKISAFQNVNPIYWLIGIGKTAGGTLGSTGGYSGFHNDFIAFLVEYGIVGLVAFLYYLIKPLREKRNFIVVLTSTVYMLACCFSIEPITIGNFSYFAFLFYAYIWSKCGDCPN